MDTLIGESLQCIMTHQSMTSSRLCSIAQRNVRTPFIVRPNFGDRTLDYDEQLNIENFVIGLLVPLSSDKTTDFKTNSPDEVISMSIVQ